MEEREYRVYYNQEDNHWWFVNRYKIIYWILCEMFDLTEKQYKLLDVGCGTGGLLQRLSAINYIDTFGMDASSTAIDFCVKRRLARISQADAMALPFKDGSIDIAISCEVLDHATIEPLVALKEIYRVCKKGAWVIISDVSFEFLKSEHDKVYHTKHRFNKEQMRQLITKTGFTISKLSYYNFILFPIIGSIRILRKFFKSKSEVSSDLGEINFSLNNLLIRFLTLERELLKRYDLPWGSSLLCVIKKE